MIPCQNADLDNRRKVPLIWNIKRFCRCVRDHAKWVCSCWLRKEVFPVKGQSRANTYNKREISQTCKFCIVIQVGCALSEHKFCSKKNPSKSLLWYIFCVQFAVRFTKRNFTSQTNFALSVATCTQSHCYPQKCIWCVSSVSEWTPNVKCFRAQTWCFASLLLWLYRFYCKWAVKMQ